MKEVVNNMKKLLTILFVLTSLFALVGCGNKVEDLEVTIKSEEMTEGYINVDVVVPTGLKDMDELKEIAYNIASQVYENNFEEIGTSTYILTIKLYDSSSSYDANDNNFGQIEFAINQSIENPGLKLLHDELVLE